MKIILCNATDVMEIGVKSVQEAQLVDTGNKLVRDNLAVSIPVLPVLGRASFEIAPNPVNENGDEEHGIEVWDGRRRANDRAPAEAHHPIGDIVRFPGVSPYATRQ